MIFMEEEEKTTKVIEKQGIGLNILIYPLFYVSIVALY
jgi:hypothetical protein